MVDSTTFDVVIVGAGPVGLCAAIELGLRGNRVLLIERDGTRGSQPRAKTLNMRSLEHFRRWGLADAIRTEAVRDGEVPTDIVFQTRLYGEHIATLPNIHFRGNVGAKDERFCEPSEWVPQFVVEKVLKSMAEELPGVELRYGLGLETLEQDDEGVTAHLKSEKGAEESCRSRYLIGADGARSTVREIIGAKMVGRYAYAANYNLVLRIPAFDADPPQPRGIMHWLINEDSPSVMGPMGDLWYVAKQLPPEKSEMSDAEIREFIAATTGRNVDFEIVARDPWYAHELIATAYRDRRVVLAGDACHLHPPFGGYGMNMGIADAIDIGWKLDAVMKGWGGDLLLESYEIERRRVHEWTIDESVRNYQLLSADLVNEGLELDGEAGAAARMAAAPKIVESKRREFHTIGLVLGYHYGGSPVIIGGEDLSPPNAEDYSPTNEPGALAPHFWIEDGVSLYDLIGQGFTLIASDADGTAFSEAAVACEIPLEIVRPQSPRLKALYGSGLTLVRPDQHIAWTGDEQSVECAVDILRVVTGQKAKKNLLGRS